MSLGGHDLFGPNAHKVQEWKKATEEKQVKMISRVFEERESRDKAARKDFIFRTFALITFTLVYFGLSPSSYDQGFLSTSSGPFLSEGL